MSTFREADQAQRNEANDFPDTDRARKRVRLSADHLTAGRSEKDASLLVLNLTEKLTGRGVLDLDSLATTSPFQFRRLPDQEQSGTLLLLGTTACQLSKGLLDSSTGCNLCDHNIGGVLDVYQSEMIGKLLDTLEALQSTVERKPMTRVAALDAYRRVLNHIHSTSRLNITTSIAGKFALRMLRSASRDARLRAAMLLQTFMRNMPDDTASTNRTNRIVILEYLQTLWTSGKLISQEAVIIALVSAAEVVGDDELNIILLRLIEYLGHPNAFISSLVASELLQLSQTLHTNMQGLLRPFWRTISVVIVKSLSARPVVAQQLSELLGMQVSGLLQIVEEHALPYLVANSELDVIGRIALSSNSPMTAFEICVKQANLPKILAFLLAQGLPDPENTIMKLLVSAAEEFGEQDLASWLNLNPSKVAFELLKLTVDAGRGRNSKQLQGLQLLAQLAHRKSSTASGGRRNDMVPSFLENNALELITLITTNFDENLMRENDVERRRCLIALGEVTKLGKGRMSTVMPQICACLRSAMTIPALCDTAYCTWSTMILSLDDDDIAGLLDQTLALTVQYWPTLNIETQQTAHTTLTQIFSKHKSMLHENIDKLPSVGAIQTLADLGKELDAMRPERDDRDQLLAFVPRISHETMVVVQLALSELLVVLHAKKDFIQRSILREQPDPLIADLIRVILDCAVKFRDDEQIVLLSAQCLGSIGCVDGTKIDSIRDKPSMIVLSNLAMSAETTGFLMFFMEHVVVKEYVSASSLRAKTFLGWALQELLKLCQLSPEITSRSRVGTLSGKDRQWLDLSEETRLVLTPFLTSKLLAPSRKSREPCSYPIYKPGISYEEWLTEITLNLLNRGLSQNVAVVFEKCWRIIHFGRGTAVSSFLLPYAALNLLLNGTEQEKAELGKEILWILEQHFQTIEPSRQDSLRQCSEKVFDVIDYLLRWVRDKRKWLAALQGRAERGLRDPAMDSAAPQIQAVDALLSSIPPEVVTRRSIDCKSYARALLHWEDYIHRKQQPSDEDYRRLQDIYAQIDEPDGIEGISSCMQVLHAESQILEHKKAGRWQAAQDWYEMQLTKQPENIDVQLNLLHALKQSGQHDVLLHHFNGMTSKHNKINSLLLPFAIESAWATAQFQTMSRFINLEESEDFNVQLGRHILDLRSENSRQLVGEPSDLWLSSARDLSYNSTASISASCDTMLRMHVSEDLRLMADASADTKHRVLEVIAKRLDILGTNLIAKHYVLGVQRAIMQLRKEVYADTDLAASWLTTAKLARKARATNQAFDAVLRAEALGDQSVAMEQAKLMWLEGRHRKAIKTLESAIESGAFNAHAYLADKDSMLSRSETQEQNNMAAKAYVLLGKWLGEAGQTQSEVIIKTLRKSTDQNKLYESGWYHLGRHYNLILESERSKTSDKQSQPYLTGEAAKLVIDNFLRALACGNKYIFQTLPKMLTLWLELVSNPEVEHDNRKVNPKFHDHLSMQRKKIITEANAYVKRYVDRLAPVTLYTILPQLVARICHSNPQIHEILQAMIAKVVQAFPQQALWTLMAVTKSIDKERAKRGLAVINKVIELQKKNTKNVPASEMKTMISAAQRFTDELLRVADYHIEGKVPKISLARDLGFNHKIAPSRLVVPAEDFLIPNIPLVNDAATMKTFRAFSKEPVTVTAFLDEALVLNSLQKPRKMSIRGSDGHVYSILAKPKDDLRKDQRLMEFDTMINRFLKRDIEASKRRMYIRTYAVIPLNEECGLIEWVNSLKTMRDVILKLYRERNIAPNYAQIRHDLDDICARSADKAKDYTERVLPNFPAVLRLWFIETFPDPSSWLNARVRYTRSAAVMSMVGHILGLGDRHGENILFEEDNGGVMHVDFNCLFDKGLTFDKPECVPFRLTHNMVDAFGTFGVEGPFRRCCEITMSLLRNHEDGLMTILETFLHDPTTDFMTAGKRRKTRDIDGLVPDTAEKMLEGVKGKVRGMLHGESVPLSVGGYVEQMINQASDRANLARMYIGWCAFL